MVEHLRSLYGMPWADFVQCSGVSCVERDLISLLQDRVESISFSSRSLVSNGMSGVLTGSPDA
jgi:hypothetical protein